MTPFESVEVGTNDGEDLAFARAEIQADTCERAPPTLGPYRLDHLVRRGVCALAPG